MGSRCSGDLYRPFTRGALCRSHALHLSRLLSSEGLTRTEAITCVDCDDSTSGAGALDEEAEPTVSDRRSAHDRPPRLIDPLHQQRVQLVARRLPSQSHGSKSV